MENRKSAPALASMLLLGLWGVTACGAPEPANSGQVVATPQAEEGHDGTNKESSGASDDGQANRQGLIMLVEQMFASADGKATWHGDDLHVTVEASAQTEPDATMLCGMLGDLVPAEFGAVLQFTDGERDCRA